MLLTHIVEIEEVVAHGSEVVDLAVSREHVALVRRVAADQNH
jgi:hypothetical protein